MDRQEGCCSKPDKSPKQDCCSKPNKSPGRGIHSSRSGVRIISLLLVALLLLIPIGSHYTLNAKTVLTDHTMSLIKGGQGECGDQCSCSEKSNCSGSEPECEGAITCADSGCKGTGCSKVCSEKYCDKYETSNSSWSCEGKAVTCKAEGCGGAKCTCPDKYCSNEKIGECPVIAELKEQLSQKRTELETVKVRLRDLYSRREDIKALIRRAERYIRNLETGKISGDVIDAIPIPPRLKFLKAPLWLLKKGVDLVLGKHIAAYRSWITDLEKDLSMLERQITPLKTLHEQLKTEIEKTEKEIESCR